MEQALSGIRILDFGRAVAGTYGTMMLADLGAEVIKIEQIPEEDSERAKAFGGGAAAMFYGLQVPSSARKTEAWLRGESHSQSLNRNKKRIALDLETEKGREVFHELVKKSDVVHDNFRPYMLKRIGIDFDTLKQINPKIISCSVTGYGETGPWNNAPSYDVIQQAVGGLMSTTGMPDGPPCAAGIAICDLCAGMNGAFGIVSALQARHRTGMAQRVDISMLDTMVSLFSYQIGILSATGEIPARRGMGVSGGGQYPYGGWVCKDGTYLALAASNPPHWRAFVKTLGMPELEKDPRFDTVAKRHENQEELRTILNDRLSTKTAQEWEKILFDAEVPVGAVNNLPQVLSHPQVLHRNMVASIKQPTGEEWKFAGNPIKIQGSSDIFKARGLNVGEDTVEVLSDVLGYSKEYLDELREMKAIWQSPK